MGMGQMSGIGMQGENKYRGHSEAISTIFFGDQGIGREAFV